MLKQYEKGLCCTAALCFNNVNENKAHLSGNCPYRRIIHCPQNTHTHNSHMPSSLTCHYPPFLQHASHDRIIAQPTYLLIMFIKGLVFGSNLVDGLCHPHHLPVPIFDGHAQDWSCLVAGLHVNLIIEPRVLQIYNVQPKLKMLWIPFR